MAAKMNTLVADDQSMNRSLVKVDLGTRGYDGETAG
jgi:CheY-like chemotaxis protein